MKGERTRPRVPWSAPRRPPEHLGMKKLWETPSRPIPTGEGASRHTRGRVCSRIPTESVQPIPASIYRRLCGRPR
jgi:hypothetical protein